MTPEFIRRPMFYTLDGHRAVVVEDMLEWARCIAYMDRRVALFERDGLTVSTVFIGLDQSFSIDGDPLLFETMVFDQDGCTGQMARYCVWEEAEAGHAEIVREVLVLLEESHLTARDALARIMLAKAGQPKTP